MIKTLENTKYVFVEPPTIEPEGIDKLIEYMCSGISNSLNKINVIKSVYNKVDDRKKMAYNIIEDNLYEISNLKDGKNVDYKICKYILELFDLPSTAVEHSSVETEQWNNNNGEMEKVKIISNIVLGSQFILNKTIKGIGKLFKQNFQGDVGLEQLKNYVRACGIFYTLKYSDLYTTFVENNTINESDTENVKKLIETILNKWNKDKYLEIFNQLQNTNKEEVYDFYRLK